MFDYIPNYALTYIITYGCRAVPRRVPSCAETGAELCRDRCRAVPRQVPSCAETAQEFGVTEHDGIEKLIDLLPDNWKEWAERTARRYTWHEPATDDMVGDMAGFRKAVYCALVDSREEQPPQEVEERVVYQDKYVSMYEGEQGYEDVYEEDDDEDPEEGPMDEDDRVVV
ncbi:hypothetical protein SASPL_129089 [Salvia splendens]|uniref:Uncharacterized protein n=1 Tax=Salvia splendens TaxID=180675 RepID=A0A8X8XAQ4_SALSN|nr:hypothetical protein SASPL_129089 [Salvia splendens]